MKSQKAKLLALLLAMLMILSLAACGDKDDDDTVSNDGTVSDDASADDTDAPTDKYTEVTIGSVGAKFVGHYDGTSAFSTDVTGVMDLVYDQTFYVDPFTREWDSNILESWEFNSDNQLVMTVKEGVYFTSGDSLKAEDVLWCIQRLATVPRNAASFDYVDFDSSYISDDNMTVYLQFTTQYGAYHQIVQAGILNKSWIEEHGGDDYDFFDISILDGSGPYIVTEFTTGISATYELKDDWWMSGEDLNGYCSINKIITLQYSDETSMMVDYETGTLDMVISLSDTSASRVTNDGLGTLRTVSSNAVCVLVFDSEGDSDLSNIKVREAIAHGIDTEALSDLGYGSLGEVAQGTLPPENKFFVSGYTYEYDVDYAISCLEESGLSNISLKWICTNQTSPAAMAEGIQSYLSILGIALDLQIYDPATCIAIWQEEGGTDLSFDQNSNTNASGDASVQYARLSSNSNFTCQNRQNADINNLLDNGKFSVSNTDRSSAYSQIQQYLYDNIELVPLTEWQVAMAYGDAIADCQVTDVYIPCLRYLKAA